MPPVSKRLSLGIFVISLIAISFNLGRLYRAEELTCGEILGSIFVNTDRGFASYAQLDQEVFKPFGFRIISASAPIPRLKKLVPETCEQIFSDWLAIANAYKQPKIPPSDVKTSLLLKFTLNGYAALSQSYYNNLAVPVPKVWSQIPSWLTMNPLTFSNYGTPGMAVLHAMRHLNVSGKSGCVIGSEQPWVEVIALQCGAKELVTVEYQNTTIIGEDRVSWIHPLDYAQNWKRQEKFDFAVSFSSIEHSGLQRYGDPRDPIGDLREVQKVRCMLKPGGVFFLGLPRGQDELVYNAHRIYGRIRLAMLFYGFELLFVFRDNNPQPVSLTNDDFFRNGGEIQDLFVLLKT